MSENSAYVAGLIDGEGCIHIEKTRGTYRARLTIGMTEVALPLLRTLKEEWGGTLYQMRKPTERWAGAWTWYASGPDAKAILMEVRPFLRLKREQADTVIELESVRENLPPRWPNHPNGQRRWTDDATGRAVALKSRIHELNRKGPRASATNAEAA